ncbi:formiminoglutamate deiminase [Leifsonia sp. EB41]|uniref:formimidoylglutamate deiminase n=1 Tax=Leifsonia sp. EB41 TaxID=3156260 RepID=UPI0035150CC3
MTTVWCDTVIAPEGVVHEVRYTVNQSGNVEAIHTGSRPHPEDLVLGAVIGGAADSHSHAFHRALRGRTHANGGDFWVWREEMYKAAAVLEPDTYYSLARAIFAEMLTAGYTVVGEFHYVHHRSNGAPYPHEMELALVEAARSVGIRLALLDTAYLAGGINQPLSAAQLRFGDGSAERYLERWYALNEKVEHLGAAIHSVRAVPPAAILKIAEGLPADVPLHIHLSEQPQENKDCLDQYGVTPTQLLEEHGVLTSRLSAVHATHLSATDIDLLGRAGSSIVMCPTTEADLGDGVGPGRELANAGATLALGSDQNAVVDPFLEMRGLEMDERLQSGRRGRFTPGEVLHAATGGGYRSLGWSVPPLHIGGPADFLEVDTRSIRTLGADLEQLIFAATSADVLRVLVGGNVVADRGHLRNGEDPAEIMERALTTLRDRP